MKKKYFHRCILILLLVTGKTVRAQDWFAVGLGIHNDVFTTTVYNGELYAGGSFTIAGGVLINNIARWNGTRWDSLGAGTDGEVRCLAVFNGELYAGGAFNHAGGQPASNIAKWNGTSWSPVGPGASSYVDAMAVYNGYLYAGGVFSHVGTTLVNDIARWNGGSWRSVGSGMGGDIPYVNSLFAFNGSLYAGGSFTLAGGVPVGLIARWNDTTWSAVGGATAQGTNYQNVYVMGMFHSELYAGGSFDTIGSAPIQYIAKLNGGNWVPLNSGVTNGIVLSMMSDTSYLYLGGFFSTIGGFPANYIALWDGTYYSKLGRGANRPVYATSFYNGNIYAAGMFTMAGTNAAEHIAKWSAVAGITEYSQNDYARVWPTPSDGIVFVSKNTTLGNSNLAIYNMLSQEVYSTKLNDELTQIDLSKEPKGIYFYRITSVGKQPLTGKLLLK
jgi:hypothetical protein